MTPILTPKKKRKNFKKSRSEYFSLIFGYVTHVALKPPLRIRQMETNTVWRESKEKDSRWYGAEIQLFVLDGWPCCMRKIEGAKARGVYKTVLNAGHEVALRFWKKNWKSAEYISSIISCVATRFFLFLQFDVKFLFYDVFEDLAEARMCRFHATRGARFSISLMSFQPDLGI